MTQSKARVASDARAGVFAVSRGDLEFRKLVASLISFANLPCAGYQTYAPRYPHTLEES